MELQVDAGYLTVTDPNPIDKEEYEYASTCYIYCQTVLRLGYHRRDTEPYLQSIARDGVQVLISALLQLPTKPSSDGPLTILPPPTTPLPRAKPLPTPKPPTKWEQFAATKGIQKKKRERAVWDEERQEWRNRWGRGGVNKEGEGAWLTEVKANAGGFLFALFYLIWNCD